jgi:formate--tetrahydrofolate ligase
MSPSRVPRRSCASTGRKGSAGIEDLARKVVELAEGGGASFAPLYADEMPLFQKVETIAKRIYHADEVIADKSIRDQLKAWEAAGYGHLPICMAKTQYSSPPTRTSAARPRATRSRCARCGCRRARASSW